MTINVLIIMTLALFLVIRFNKRNDDANHFDIWIGKLKHYMQKIGCSEQQTSNLIASMWKKEYENNMSPDAAYWHKAYKMAIRAYKRATIKQ